MVTSDETRAADARYRIAHSGGTAEVTVNQRVGGGLWHYLGNYAFDPQSSPMVTLAANDNGSVAADAVRFVGGPGGATDIAYLHSDHLGTPQVMTDANAQVLWWRDQTPFGQTVAEGGFSQNPLRFPGQIADAESGLAYNYFRDYDPALGRYIQSDPIGLKGGLNTYGYVMGNPLRYTDPTGQFIPFVPIVVGIAERYGSEIIIGAAISAGIEYYCTGTVTAQGVLIGAILGPVGRVVGGRAWALASRYVPGVRWAGEAVGRGAGAVGGAVSAALGRLGGRAGTRVASIADEILPTPRVGDPKLRNIVNDLYKGTTNPTRVGHGTTADAVRSEILTGNPTAGRFHSQKAQDYARGLENWLRKNPNAPYHDQVVAQSLLDDLLNALGTKP